MAAGVAYRQRFLQPLSRAGISAASAVTWLAQGPVGKHVSMDVYPGWDRNHPAGFIDDLPVFRKAGHGLAERECEAESTSGSGARSRAARARNRRGLILSQFKRRRGHSAPIEELA